MWIMDLVESVFGFCIWLNVDLGFDPLILYLDWGNAVSLFFC